MDNLERFLCPKCSKEIIRPKGSESSCICGQKISSIVPGIISNELTEEKIRWALEEPPSMGSPAEWRKRRDILAQAYHYSQIELSAALGTLEMEREHLKIVEAQIKVFIKEPS